MNSEALADSSSQCLKIGNYPVACLYASVADYSDSITPAELHMVARAVPKRRAEFSTGRWLARQAMSRLGLDESEILVGNNRQPVWPNGIVGSITHSDGLAAAVVALESNCSGLGIDMERMNRVDESILSKVLTPKEQDDLNGVDPTLIFSAKEACYKLLYPLIGEYVGFHAIEVSVNEANSNFSTRYIGKRSANAIIEQASGHFTQVEGHWVSFALLCGD